MVWNNRAAADVTIGPDEITFTAPGALRLTHQRMNIHRANGAFSVSGGLFSSMDYSGVCATVASNENAF